ncbi:MAG TPA: NADPH-dependent FMN reductase [Longimicrobium sp.]|nr:NADPH-dependent FMN reductase [Longimicrobium sp.]
MLIEAPRSGSPPYAPYLPVASTSPRSAVRILAISGSLRASSSNTLLLMAVAELAPEGVEVVMYGGLGDLPHFNPDLDKALDDPDLPAQVRDLRTQVGDADALLISSPEYAHGVPGSLKNALDWLVGGSEMPGKPVALLNASPRSTHAQASLGETLRTMSADVVPGSPFDAPLERVGAAGRPGAEAEGAIHAALAALARAVAGAGGERVE